MKYEITYGEEGGGRSKTIGHAATLKEAKQIASAKIREMCDGRRYYWCGPRDWDSEDPSMEPVGGYSTENCELAAVIYRAVASHND